jgi:predicted nucleic acid-binding protein
MGYYLIDSNVIANFILVKFPEKAMIFLADIIDEIPNISVITKIEILSWRSAIMQEEINVASFVNYSNIIALSDSIVDKCIEIRRNCRIKTPDAIIAATAITNDFTLLTSDADFNRIPDLKILNPFNL